MEEIFLIHIILILRLIKIIIYPLQKVVIILLKIEKINIPTKYSNFANLFLYISAIEILE